VRDRISYAHQFAQYVVFVEAAFAEIAEAVGVKFRREYTV
jgi:hypothetical protein